MERFLKAGAQNPDGLPEFISCDDRVQRASVIVHSEVRAGGARGVRAGSCTISCFGARAAHCLHTMSIVFTAADRASFLPCRLGVAVQDETGSVYKVAAWDDCRDVLG